MSSMGDWLTLVIATRNERKLAEFRALLTELPIRVVSAAEALGIDAVVVESAESLEATARRKALEVCRATGLVTLAEASGLEVDALGGRPGPRSERFAHERSTDAENNAALLQALEEIEDNERAARFRCVLALATPWKGDDVVFAEGKCEGSIARTPRGSGGFGYDPLFVVTEAGDRVMAELSEDQKRDLSQRARAVKALYPTLVALLEETLEAVERIAR